MKDKNRELIIYCSKQIYDKFWKELEIEFQEYTKSISKLSNEIIKQKYRSNEEE
jgi:hypothetical protein